MTQISSKQKAEHRSEEEGDLYCICREPDSGQWMIACDFCDDWYHGKCVNIKEEDGDLLEKYCCPLCREKNRGQTLWKRKCKFPDCRRPAVFADSGKVRHRHTKSKYCSPEHGIAWMKLNITLQTDPANYSSRDEGFRNSPLSISELATVVRATGPSLAKFKDLGNHLPTLPSSIDQSSVYLASENTRLKQLADERDEWSLKNIYNGHKATYLYYTKIRCSAQKEICGFDPRLVYSEKEWQAWCDSSIGIYALQAIQKLRDVLEERRKAATSAAEIDAELESFSTAGNQLVNSTRKHKRPKKRQAPVQINIDLAEVLAVLNPAALSTTEPPASDIEITVQADIVCTKDKRSCSKHEKWQSIRSNEVELDQQICSAMIHKINLEIQSITRQATLRSFKDSTKGGGKCTIIAENIDQ
ncbi:uncharacterized protein V1516DRAFT_674683 [Lipomyces oligophaga]|uniref:uncharacterized protein n=1 Tax=Lipomyces oligophaga TaxID=45792 RepID=UPI0034CE8B96